MNTSLHISAFIDQPEFLQTLVERLAYCQNDLGYGKEKMPKGLKALESSSTETYVSGTVGLDFTGKNESKEHINMPFITNFLFTCIKGEKEPYQLNWSCSMS